MLRKRDDGIMSVMTVIDTRVRVRRFAKRHVLYLAAESRANKILMRHRVARFVHSYDLYL